MNMEEMSQMAATGGAGFQSMLPVSFTPAHLSINGLVNDYMVVPQIQAGGMMSMPPGSSANSVDSCHAMEGMKSASPNPVKATSSPWTPEVSFLFFAQGCPFLCQCL
jgi:hypothetical protein